MPPESQPESDRKPKHIDQAAEALEGGKVESLALAQFERDAEDFTKLQEKSVQLALNKEKLREAGGLMNVPGGERGLEQEEAFVQDKMDKILEKYGEGKEDFVHDVMTMNELTQQIAQKEAKLKQLESADSFNHPGGKRGLEIDKGFLADRVAELKKQLAEIKDRRSETKDEGPDIEIGEIEIDLSDLGENPFDGLKEEEIDAALSKMESGELERTHVDKSGKELSEVEVSLRELQEIEKQRVREEAQAAKEKEQMGKETEEAIKMAIETSAESLKEKEFEAAVAAAKDVNELKAAVEKMGAIARSDGKKYDAATINGRIDMALQAPVLLGQITRNHGLRDKVRELIKAARGEEKAVEPVPLTPEMQKKKPEGFSEKEEAFFKEGEEMSKAHAEGIEYVTDEMLNDQWVSMKMEGLSDAEIDAAFEKAEAGPLERRKVDMVLEKNELPPEKMEALRMDLARLENERFALMNGIELRLEDPISGKPFNEYRPGIKELEKDLVEKYGVDVKAIENAKDDKELEAALKKENSFGSKLRRGMKFLFSPGYRKTMENYQRRLDELSDVEDNIAQTKLMMENPKAAAEVANRRLMRTLVRRANQVRNQPKPMGSPLSLKF